MKVAVTGASGFLGSVLVRELAARHIETISLSRSSPPPTIAGPVVLVHLGEDADLARAEAAGDDDIERRLAGFEAALALTNFQRVIYVSSGVVYGDQQARPRRPDEPVDPKGIYARGKVACEAKADVSVRLGNVYGPGMSPVNVLSDLIRGFRAVERPVKVRNLAPVRDFIWVEDVARGLADFAMHQTSKGVFNVASGEGTSVQQLSELVPLVMGVERGDVIVTQPVARESTLILDIARTTEVLGWRPHVSLNEGLARLLASNEHS